MTNTIKKEKFTQDDVGKFIVYIPDGGDRCEIGKIKSISDETHAFIVYNCNGEWERYTDYTAARTRIENVEFINDDKIKIILSMDIYFRKPKCDQCKESNMCDQVEYDCPLMEKI